MLPFVIVIFMAVHFWRVRKDGGISGSAVGRGRSTTWPTFPNISCKRSRERRKALGLPVEGDEATEAPAARDAAGGADVPAAAEAGEGAGGGDADRRRRGSPRPRRRQDPRAPARSARSGAGPRRRWRRRGRARRRRRRGRTAVAAPPAPTATGPGRPHPAAAHRRQVGLDPADPRRGSGQGPRLAAPARLEFASILSSWPFITIFSALVKAPLLGLADLNTTPNPSKAPWYFLGLQELLTMFHPMVAGRDRSPASRWRCSRSRRSSTRTRRTSRRTASSPSRCSRCSS